MDCIWVNLKNVGPSFFKFTVCQFIQFIRCHLHSELESHSQLLRGHDFAYGLPISHLKLIVSEIKQNYRK